MDFQLRGTDRHGFGLRKPERKERIPPLTTRGSSFIPKRAYVIEFPGGDFAGGHHLGRSDATGAAASAGPRGWKGGRGGTKFTVTLSDVTTGYTFSTSATVAGASKFGGVDCRGALLSDNKGDVLPLAPFGMADFGSDFTGAKTTA